MAKYRLREDPDGFVYTEKKTLFWWLYVPLSGAFSKREAEKKYEQIVSNSPTVTLREDHGN
jgi:hypothetical protein